MIIVYLSFGLNLFLKFDFFGFDGFDFSAKIVNFAFHLIKTPLQKKKKKNRVNKKLKIVSNQLDLKFFILETDTCNRISTILIYNSCMLIN